MQVMFSMLFPSNTSVFVFTAITHATPIIITIYIRSEGRSETVIISSYLAINRCQVTTGSLANPTQIRTSKENVQCCLHWALIL